MVQIYKFFVKRKSNSHKKLRFGGGEATRTAQYPLPKLPKFPNLPNLLIPHNVRFCPEKGAQPRTTHTSHTTPPPVTM